MAESLKREMLLDSFFRLRCATKLGTSRSNILDTRGWKSIL